MEKQKNVSSITFLKCASKNSSHFPFFDFRHELICKLSCKWHTACCRLVGCFDVCFELFVTIPCIECKFPSFNSYCDICFIVAYNCIFSKSISAFFEESFLPFLEEILYCFSELRECYYVFFSYDSISNNYLRLSHIARSIFYTYRVSREFPIIYFFTESSVASIE